MNEADQLRRVRKLVRAAKSLADPSQSNASDFRARLQRETGLSAQGVDLALREHLETNPTDQELLSLVGRAGRTQRAYVVLSANVFTAGLRALALAAATAPQVTVRCSSRENVFVPALLSQLDDPELRRSMLESDTITPAAGDEVHLYGSDESLAEICSGLPTDVLVRAHGTGFGLALVGHGIEAEEAARCLVRDIVPFDQRGCLSPRIALVQGREHARALAQSLSVLLDQAGAVVPVGASTPQDQAEFVRFRDTATVAGEWFQAGQGGVAVLEQPRSAWLAPPGRNLVVVACDASWPWPDAIDGMERHAAAIGVSGDEAGFFGSVLARCAGARRSTLGRMQRPAFDGPVDLRHQGVESPREVIARVRSG